MHPASGSRIVEIDHLEPFGDAGKFQVYSKVPPLSGNHLSAGDPLASVGVIHKSTKLYNIAYLFICRENFKILCA